MQASDSVEPLQRGFCVPAAAYCLAIECERLGIRLTLRNGVTLDVDGPFTEDILAELRKWKPHVIAILNYKATDAHHFDTSIQPPSMGPIQQVNR